jgi:hypothetical protein
LLGAATPQSAGCKVIRVTEEHDNLSKEGFQFALDAVSDSLCTLWVSLPCTGGSRLSSLNWGKGESARIKIAGHIKAFFDMLPRVRALALACRERGGVVCFEHPGGCYYWETQVVKQLIDELRLTKVHLHCCQFGLVSTREWPEFGFPI